MFFGIYSCENPILIIIVGVEIILRGLPQEEILDLGYPKLHRYIRFNIKLLQSEKRCVVFYIFA